MKIKLPQSLKEGGESLVKSALALSVMTVVAYGLNRIIPADSKGAERLMLRLGATVVAVVVTDELTSRFVNTVTIGPKIFNRIEDLPEFKEV